MFGLALQPRGALFSFPLISHLIESRANDNRVYGICYPLIRGRIMNPKSILLVLFAFLALLCAAQIAYYAPKLPDQVASHFRFDGTPDGYSSRMAFFVLYAVLMGFLLLCFLGGAWLLRRIPPSLINLPKKDYWLAPERRQETFAYLDRWLIILGGATVLFMLVLFQYIIMANLRGEGARMEHDLWVPLIAYLGFTAVMTVHLFLRFVKKR